MHDESGKRDCRKRLHRVERLGERELRVLLCERDAKLLERVALAADCVDPRFLDLVEQVVEPARAQDLGRDSNRDLRKALSARYAGRGENTAYERDTGCAACKLAQHPEEGEHDELAEHADVEAVTEDATVPQSPATLEVAPEVDVRELRLEDDNLEAEVDEGEGDDEWLEDGEDD